MVRRLYTENIPKLKFQTCITFAVVLIINADFDIVFECKYCVLSNIINFHLQTDGLK